MKKNKRHDRRRWIEVLENQGEGRDAVRTGGAVLLALIHAILVLACRGRLEALATKRFELKEGGGDGVRECFHHRATTEIPA